MKTSEKWDRLPTELREIILPGRETQDFEQLDQFDQSCLIFGPHGKDLEIVYKLNFEEGVSNGTSN